MLVSFEAIDAVSFLTTFHEMKNSEVNQSEKKQFAGSDGLHFFPDTCQGLVCSLNFIIVDITRISNTQAVHTFTLRPFRCHYSQALPLITIDDMRLA